jgi:dephospho-CoA kinase
MSNKIIIGLVGEIASGKDTVADYLAENHNSKTVSFSQSLRDIVDRLFIPQTRENLANLGIKLREQFGQDILSKTVAKEIETGDKSIACLPNVRLESDIDHLKDMDGFVLVGIETEQKTRYERLTKRGQNADDNTKTWEEFIKDSELPTETQIRDLIKKCSHKLDNNGTVEELYKQIEELLAKLKS